MNCKIVTSEIERPKWLTRQPLDDHQPGKESLIFRDVSLSAISRKLQSSNPFLYISPSPFFLNPRTLKRNPSCRGSFLVTAHLLPSVQISMMNCAGKRPASDGYSSDSGAHDHQHAPANQKRLRPTTRFAS